MVCQCRTGATRPRFIEAFLSRAESNFSILPRRQQEIKICRHYFITLVVIRVTVIVTRLTYQVIRNVEMSMGRRGPSADNHEMFAGRTLMTYTIDDEFRNTRVIGRSARSEQHACTKPCQ